MADTLIEHGKQYNEAVITLGRPEKQLDFQPLFRSFYNRYYHQGTTILFQSFSLYPFLPVTLIWRCALYLLANTEYFNSPTMRHQIVKSNATFMALGYQTLAIVSLSLQSLSISYLYFFKMV